MSRLIYATWADPIYDVDFDVRGRLRGGIPEVGPGFSHGGLPAEGPTVEDLEYEYEPGRWTAIPEEWNEDHVIETLLDANT